MGGGSSSGSTSSNCSQGFISWCESFYGTSNCTACSEKVTSTGVDLFADYLDSSKIKFLKIKSSKEIPINYIYNVNKGILYIDNPSSASIVKLLNNDNLFTVVVEGSSYVTGLLNTLILFRKNIQGFSKCINIFTSLATTEMIKTSNSDLNTINILFTKKIGFSIKDYNYYLNNFYYDYNKDNTNKYALTLIKINAIINFIWNLIYKKTILLKISLNYNFYITFYMAILDNLNGTNPILSYQINPYFINYDLNGILNELDDLCIIKLTSLINNENDLTQIIILKTSSKILSQEELISNELITNNLLLSPSIIKNRLNECFLYKDSILSSYGLLK